MPFAQVNDVKLHYEMEGSGPPLLMVAGTGLPGATWRIGPSAQYAAEGFTVITFDHRGTGGSDKPDVDYSTRMFAADAEGLLQALDIPQAHVLGHSMGGRVVQWLALDHPERVRSLVLAAGSPGEIDPQNPVMRGIPLNDAVELAEKGYEGFIRSIFASTFFFTPEYCRDHPDVIQSLTDTFWTNRPPLKLYLRHTIARQQHQTAERLHEITAPTLVIVGSVDTITGNLLIGQYLAEHIPGAEFKTVDGSAHMLFWQKPTETCSAIVEFLRRH
jgi:pimeloyl-ACP methyl ester carboxylesterase